MTTTTYMELDLPVASTTIGPLWASMIVTALTTVDSHDHSDGKGALITPAGMDINADLDMGENNLIGAWSLRLLQHFSVLAEPSDVCCIYAKDGHLFYNHSSGTAIQITSGSSVNATVSGAVSGSLPTFPYTVTTSDGQKVLFANTSSGARQFTLPAATNILFFRIKDIDGNAATNNITVVPAGSDTIDGASGTLTLTTAYGSWGFLSDGVSKWYKI